MPANTNRTAAVAYMVITGRPSKMPRAINAIAARTISYQPMAVNLLPRMMVTASNTTSQSTTHNRTIAPIQRAASEST